jgi:hypothetical protein
MAAQMQQAARVEKEEQEQREASLRRDFMGKQTAQQHEVDELRLQVESLKLKQHTPPPPQPD